ncbi:S24 family peptidase [Oribacterium sp. NK2B42]|uniref:S24 family peptidase n=1 Tax=Oribacterium sp. NK2B42 TaxID=689781 RepID=UPI000492E4FB
MVPEYAYKDKNMVAIRINDDTLSPEIRRGDNVIVWLNEPPTNGDFVLTITQRSDDLRCYRM